MKLSQAKDYLHLVQAAAEGKTIQEDKDSLGWLELVESTFTQSPNRYRVKPEISYREFTLDEIPVGKIVRRKAGDYHPRHVIHSAIISNGDALCVINGLHLTARELLRDYEFMDGTPCGTP